MTDRELLELAAKAAGLVITSWARSCPRIETKYGAGIVVPWNPLADDGDALRLRNTLQMSLIDNGAKVYAEVSRYPAGAIVHELYERDLPGGFAIQSSIDAATRRAIVRCAAEIGRRMQ